MNPEQYEVAALMTHLLNFKQGFSKVKSDTHHLQKSAVAFQCNLCPMSSGTIKLSSDSDIAFTRFKIHATSDQHEQNLGRCRSYYLKCNPCNKLLTTPRNFESSYNSIWNHLNSSKHIKNVEIMEKVEHYNLSNKLSTVENKMERLDDSLDEIIEKLENLIFILNPPPVIPSPPVEPIQQEPWESVHPMNIWCQVCQCPITISNDNDATLHNIGVHLNGSRHYSNIETSGGKFLRCLICQCRVPISEEEVVSYENMVRHITGSRHVQNVGCAKDSDYSEDGSSCTEDEYYSLGYTCNNY